MRKLYILFLFVFCIGLVSADTVNELTFIGSDGACFGSCLDLEPESYGYFSDDGNISFTSKVGLNATSELRFLSSFTSVINGSVAFRGASYDVLNAENISNNSYVNIGETNGNYTFTSTLEGNFTSAKLYININSHSYGYARWWNFTSSSWTQAFICTDFCDFGDDSPLSSWSMSNDLFNDSNVSVLNVYNIDVGIDTIDNITLELFSDSETVSSYVQDFNISFGDSQKISVWDSGNFTENDVVIVDVGFYLNASYPEGAPLSVLPVSAEANSTGYVLIENFSLYYTPVPSGSSYWEVVDFIPLSEFPDLILGGASFKEVAKSYNPAIYDDLVSKWSEMWKKENFDNFLSNALWDFPVLLIKYMFRQPASLVSVGSVF